MSNDQVGRTEHQRITLQELRGVAKFHEDMTRFYPGAASEKQRVEYEQYVNDLFGNLLTKLPGNDRKAATLSEFRRVLQHFEVADTEDRNRVCGYLEEIMDILEIDSSRKS